MVENGTTSGASCGWRQCVVDRGDREGCVGWPQGWVDAVVADAQEEEKM